MVGRPTQASQNVFASSRLKTKSSKIKLTILQHRLSLQYGAVQIVYWWASADEFVKMLTTASDEDKFLDMAPSLASAEDRVFRKSIEQLTELLNAPEERTRSRAAVALRFMQEKRPDRMAKHAPAIMQNLVPLLDDSSTTVIGEALGTLQSFGPAARDAVTPLTKRMSDDTEWYAPDAAVAIAKLIHRSTSVPD